MRYTNVESLLNPYFVERLSIVVIVVGLVKSNSVSVTHSRNFSNSVYDNTACLL